MIFRLEYCNKESVTARVDIQKGGATPIYTVEGTAEPFVLFYNNDKGDKSGSFRSSGADINIYETAEFNIDELKTSNETEISVKYYINNILNWSGFVIPDFFSETITGGKGAVSMVASDRLGTLKGVTLSGLSAKISNRALAEMCLANTGLSLPLYTMADFTGDGGNIFNSEVLSQRMIDTKGRSISCYDILSSLLEQTNSLLIQRAGAWHIINKVQLEAGAGSLYSNATTSMAWSENTVNFSDVNVGARRTIIPVASMVGVYHEHGGGRLHPDNYDFSQGLTGWTAINGFNAVVENRSIEGYTLASNPVRMVPNYGEVTTKNTIRSINPTPGFDPDYDIVPYLKSPDIPIVSVNDDVVDINVDVSAIGPHNAALRYVVLATNGATRLYLNASGTFEPFVSTNERHISFLSFGQPGINIASVKSRSITGKLDNPAGYSISVRVYGSGEGNPIFINFASVSFSNADNIPKGTMYKREQGANYTKTHDIPTVLWGDYLTNGLDGYFYEYPIDDTSSLYMPNGSLHSTWTAYGDTDQIPLLQHISRQKARMFSVAHDLLTADIDAVNFDPLSIFVDCNDKRYVVVSSKVDFLRSRVSVDLEEVVYSNNIVRDFIYSYFGDGEEGIKSIGGISSGASGGTGIDPGLIGGINERIDDVNDKVNNIKVGPANLLLNTGFLGDFQSLTVDALTAVTGNTPINTNSLVHWVYSNTEVIDAPSRSGKGVKIGSIQQTVNLKQGSHVLSFWAKGNSLTVDLVESVHVSIDSEYKKYSFDITVATSGAHTFSLSGDASIYEIMLSEGNAEVSYSYSEEDDLKAIAQLQAINVITDAIKNYDTDILGGLILTSMIQLGKYKDGVLEKVNAGMSGIWNSDDDPSVWSGGTFEQAIRTVQKIKTNPGYNPTEAEWADMAKIVMTHGGDGFFRGFIYALGGMFRGRVETNVDGNRIVLNPEDREIQFFDSSGQQILKFYFVNDSWIALTFLEYYASGNFKRIVSFSNNVGYLVQDYGDGTELLSEIRYGVDGAITNSKLINMTDTAADATLVSGQWYRDGRIIKVKP